MYGFIAGYSDTSDIRYCPVCGNGCLDDFADGTAKCNECGTRFGVIEVDDDEGTEDKSE